MLLERISQIIFANTLIDQGTYYLNLNNFKNIYFYIY